MARLLVVEDEGDVRELLVRHVRQDGHHVMAAGSAGEALTAVEYHGLPDAAVIDYDLPDMDGVQLLERLRAVRPTLPAVFVTVMWTGDVIARIRATGCRHLPKPFSRHDLHGALRLILPPDGGQGER
ncbi:response regulator [Spirillospora albida]|uniref:response regulator n=1 Tax=Spirillospora albida TaxID=58123 RepID=UPI00068F61F6|nr:response regulator [Spirillospora albida]